MSAGMGEMLEAAARTVGQMQWGVQEDLWPKLIS